MTMPRDRVATARSWLFVPASRPDRFDKAASSGADLVIIDLEDAVAPVDKERARDATEAWLAHGNRAVIRINAPGTPWSEADLGMAARYGCPIMIPKAEDHAVLADLAARTAGRCDLVPLIETALGVERAHQVCSTPGAVRAAFGNVDLAAQLGVAHDDHDALACARSRLIVASAAAGIGPPVDGVTTAVRDGAAAEPGSPCSATASSSSDHYTALPPITDRSQNRHRPAGPTAAVLDERMRFIAWSPEAEELLGHPSVERCPRTARTAWTCAQVRPFVFLWPWRLRPGRPLMPDLVCPKASRLVCTSCARQRSEVSMALRVEGMSPSRVSPVT